MELKASFTIIFTLFLLLASSCLSEGELDVANMDSEIYDIDYRGPETHSHLPPPSRSGGRHHHIHPESTRARVEAEGLKATNGARGKKVRG
ncbi:hypothetical protein NMG60_11005487 [Bertholletia excelsa]